MPLSQPEVTTMGLIIGCFQSGEHDKILRVVTDKFGKIAILAKSCRGNKSKKIHIPELFDHGKFSLTPPKGSSELYRFKKDSVLRNHPLLMQSFDKMVVGSFLCELVDFLTIAENKEDTNVLEEMLKQLSELGKSDSPRAALRLGYHAALTLLEGIGFPLESAPKEPTFNNLKRIMLHIEELSNRTLNTSSSIDLIVRRL